MSAMYHGSTAASTSNSYATRATSAWNGFQQDYGGRGLSRQDMSSLYAHQKGESPAAVAAAAPAKTWNEFQHEYAGTGLSREQVAHLYHTQKQPQQRQPAPEPKQQTISYSESPFKYPAPSQIVHPSTASGFRFGVKSGARDAPQAPQGFTFGIATPSTVAAKPEARDAPKAPQGFAFGTSAFTFGDKPESQDPPQDSRDFFSGNMPSEVGAGAYVAPPSHPYHIQSPFGGLTPTWGFAFPPTMQTTTTESNAALRYEDIQENMVYHPFSVDSRGQDRSPEELAFKYYRRRQAKTKSVQSAKAVIASASNRSNVADVHKEEKQKLALSTVQEADEDEEERDMSSVRGIEATIELEPNCEETESMKEKAEEPVEQQVKAKNLPTDDSHNVQGDKPVDTEIMSTDDNLNVQEEHKGSMENATAYLEHTTKTCASRELLSLVFNDADSAPIGDGVTGRTMKGAIAGGNKRIAVKVVPSVNSKRTSARVTKEMEALLTLPGHDHVAQFHGLAWLDDKKKCAVVTELVAESENLMTRLYTDKSSTMSETTKHQLILQLVDAVDHLHTHNITHRDLTPTHVLISTKKDSSSLTLIDFGLPTLKNAASVAQNKTGVTGFHPAYASPELLGGQIARDGVEAWKKSDIYSFAVVLMEILMDDQLWEGELPVFFMKVVAERGERPFEVDELLLHGHKALVLEGIVAQARHQDPDRRPIASVLRAMLTKIFTIDDEDADTTERTPNTVYWVSSSILAPG